MDAHRKTGFLKRGLAALLLGTAAAAACAQASGDKPLTYIKAKLGGKARVLNNAMVLLGINSYAHEVANGIVVLLAVLVSTRLKPRSL